MEPVAPLVVGIDGSSQRTGIAVMHRRRLLWSGVVRAKGKTPQARCISMAAQVVRTVGEVLYQHRGQRPVVIVTEFPGGAAQGRSAGRGLVTMGYACGCIDASLSIMYEVRSVPIVTWSRMGEKKNLTKEVRAAKVAGMFPAYDQSQDPGLDQADAIGIAAWASGCFGDPTPKAKPKRRRRGQPSRRRSR